MSIMYDAACERLDAMLSLEPGWDSYQAKRIDPECVRIAKAILYKIGGSSMYPVPCSDGGVQLEGEYLGRTVEIVIDPGQWL